MTDIQIMIEDYFNIMRDDYGRIYCIQDIGDPKELIKAIREQNEYIQAKEQECEELKNFHINLVGVKECEIKELLKLKQTLAEIKEIAQYDVYTSRTDLCLKLNWVKKKISECEV